MQSYDLIGLEIGVRDKLTEANARLGATAFRLARQRYPRTALMISIGGYDKDPRDLWEIPEVRAYLRSWAQFAGIADWRDAMQVNWLENHGLATLQLCGVFADDSPIRVNLKPAVRN